MQEKDVKFQLSLAVKKFRFLSIFVFLSFSVSVISRRVKNLFVLYSGGTKKAWTCLFTVPLGAFYFI